MLAILYLVHDLTDPAVARRVTMLTAGGATVRVAGFRRELRPAPAELGAGAPIDLGMTRDGRFAQRIAAVARAALGLRQALAGMAAPDIIIARNLEMLALAHRVAGLYRLPPAIVYESLDIHRLLLGSGAVSSTLRTVERRLAADAALLMTSSPAFLREYFGPYGQVSAPVELVENKVLALEGERGMPQVGPRFERPWVIGWFGALRCSCSLAILKDVASRMDGAIEVVMRGRPAYSEIPDFDAQVRDAPHLRFEGSYRPEDLQSHYAAVDFCWAIDFFEAGQNSEWLLPNRLYESGAHGVMAIARTNTETARFLQARNIGIVLDEGSADDLVARLSALTDEELVGLSARQQALDASTWTYGVEDCRALVKRLAALAPSQHMEAAA
ncbi:glycosyltransferase [Rhizobium sp. EC-SD404]|uniref:glycosyltransferase n=1 Tax=Rhizobium sp. EC-SD404 TaxID=2038389 RepID=UPI0012567C4B|nr:glycosyltransferase [Rhizobium sp. EC-SD404]VVT10104.1 Succinoglycan biosynthesis protein ExoL [Rhizobium sp. EC-SD404]